MLRQQAAPPYFKANLVIVPDPGPRLSQVAAGAPELAASASGLPELRAAELQTLPQPASDSCWERKAQFHLCAGANVG